MAGWASGWITCWSSRTLGGERQTQREASVQSGRASCVAAVCPALCRAPGAVLRERWETDLCRAAFPAADRDGPSARLVLETVPPRAVLIPVAVADGTVSSALGPGEGGQVAEKGLQWGGWAAIGAVSTSLATDALPALLTSL